jgi:hypothetical protein
MMNEKDLTRSEEGGGGTSIMGYPAAAMFKRKGTEFVPYYYDNNGDLKEAVWAPQPGSQVFFLLDTTVEVLYEGTRGPGKTDALLMDFCQEVGKGWGAEWRGILFRQTHPQLRDIIEKSKKWIKRIWPEAIYNEVKTMWEWPTGERLYFAHFDVRSDYDNYHGHCIKNGEVLTPGGWKDIRSFKIGDEAYSVAPDGTLTPDIVGHVTREHYTGELPTLDTHFSHMAMTPEHRVMVERGSLIEGVPFKDLVQGDKIRRVVDWVGSSHTSVTLPAVLKTSRMKVQPTTFAAEDYFEFMGWFVSEGSTLKTLERNRKRVTLSQKRADGRAAIHALLTRMGIEFSEDTGGFVFHHAEMWAEVHPLGGSYEKFIPRWMLDAEPRLLKIMLDAAIFGDGHINENGKTCQYESMSPQLRDDIAEVAIKCGYAVGTNDDVVNIHFTKTSFTFRGQNDDWQKPHYDGPVYCIGLKTNHAFVVRQNGYVWISSNSYPWIGWEELTNWPSPDCYKSMFSCSRSTAKGMPRKIRSTTNPYGVGHNWVKARWRLPINGPIIDGRKPTVGPLITDSKDEDGNTEPPRRAIHGYLDENVLLLHADPEYKGRIKTSARNSSELAAWLDGSWDIVAGGMFDDIWGEYRDAVVVDPFDVPPGWRIYRAYDHGSSKPFSVGWYARSDGTDLKLRDKINSDGTVVKGRSRATVRGDLFRINEWYGWRGQPNEGSRMLVADIARGIIEREIKWGLRDRDANWTRVSRGPADSSIFDDNTNGSDISIANDFEKPVMLNGVKHRGIFWERADKGPGSREQGWEQIRKRMKASKRPPGGYREIPGLFVTTNCVQWLRCVPVLPRDELKIDDVDDEAEDHNGDETRYMLRFDSAPGMTTRRVGA